MEKDGVIQRFEFTVELAWKTIQDILMSKGYIDIKGPKPVKKKRFTDGQEWINMLEDRNKSTHLYDETLALEIFDKIQLQYLALLTGFKTKILNQSDK